MATQPSRHPQKASLSYTQLCSVLTLVPTSEKRELEVCRDSVPAAFSFWRDESPVMRCRVQAACWELASTQLLACS